MGPKLKDNKMSEKEIRSTVRNICAELDRRVRWLASKSIRKVILPVAFGTGLAVSGGCSDQGGISVDCQLCGDDAYYPDAGTDISFDSPAYMAPDATIDLPCGGGCDIDNPDASIDIFYPAPDAAYMAPDPEKKFEAP